MTTGWFKDFVVWRKKNHDTCDLESFRKWFSGIFASNHTVKETLCFYEKVGFRCSEPFCDFAVQDPSTDKGANQVFMHLTDPMNHVYQLVFDKCSLEDRFSNTAVRRIREFVSNGVRCKYDRVIFESLRIAFEKQGYCARRKRKREEPELSIIKRKACLDASEPFLECLYEPSPLGNLFPELLEI